MKLISGNETVHKESRKAQIRPDKVEEKEENYKIGEWSAFMMLIAARKLKRKYQLP